jgi:SAM-dependent methyltransferase
MAMLDAVAYKETTRQQWQSAADAWHRWEPTIRAWFSPATEVMLDLARVGNGSHVLDVAAGAGEPAITAATRVGETGRVLATDISSNILAFAHQAARARGVGGILETRVMDGENLELPDGSFDAVISRVGLIYFPDRQRGLSEMRRVLRPGGRVAIVAFSTPSTNGFVAVPISIIRRRAQLPAAAPGHPGPFSMGAPGVLEQELCTAGFHDVEVRVVPSPVRLASAAECMRLERESFGALHQMLAGLSPAEQEETWAEVGTALQQFEGSDGFEGPCELLVGSIKGRRVEIPDVEEVAELALGMRLTMALVTRMSIGYVS